MTEGGEVDAMAAAQMRVLEMFGAVCADPDNMTVGQEADAALRHVDDLLAAAGATG